MYGRGTVKEVKLGPLFDLSCRLLTSTSDLSCDLQFDGVWAIGMYWCSKRDNPTLCYIFTLLMALLIKDICSSIYERIFEAFFMDKTCRVVKTHTFSADSMLQGDVSLDFHRRPYPKYQVEVQVDKSEVEVRSQISEVEVRKVVQV